MRKIREKSSISQVECEASGKSRSLSFHKEAWMLQEHENVE